jgi:uncharacterized membrane protein
MSPSHLAETTRLETFADGVFAIAITLLVLEIKVPHADQAHGGLWPALLGLWPSYVGYLVSFVTIGIMWVNHHAIFQYVRKCDRRFLFANVFFLMGIAFTPFPTAVLAEHLPDPATRNTAAVFFNGFYILMAVLFNVVWRTGVSGGRLLGHQVHRGGLETISRRYAAGPLMYVLTTAVAFASAWVSLILFFALAVFWMLSERGEE